MPDELFLWGVAFAGAFGGTVFLVSAIGVLRSPRVRKKKQWAVLFAIMSAVEYWFSGNYIITVMFDPSYVDSLPDVLRPVLPVLLLTPSLVIIGALREIMQVRHEEEEILKSLLDDG